MNHIQPFQLFELHYTDIFPKRFEEFRKKYIKISKTPAGKDMYVQFTNFKGDVLDRVSHESTDHADPMGNYAYPLSYVVNHPADLWYGMDANNMRILEKTDYCKTLKLSNMSESDCSYQASKMFKGKRSVSDAIWQIKKTYKDRIEPMNSGYWGRIFFQLLQVDLTSELNDKGKHDILSSKEQTNILLRMGYNAIEDEATKDTVAVINNREPQQICFLDRKAFKVVEIFNLNYNNKRAVATTIDPAKLVTRQWVSAILNVLDNDKIKEQNKKVSDGEYYSVKGREITIEYEKPESYYAGKTLFKRTKFHKTYKLSDANIPKIYIKTEKGEIIYVGTNEQKLSDILEEIQYKWDKIKNKKDIAGWIPRSLKLKAEEEERAREEKYKKDKDVEYNRMVKNLPKFIGRLEYWKKIVESDFIISKDKKTQINLFKGLETYGNIADFHKISKALIRIQTDIKVIEDDSHETGDDYAFILIQLPNDVDRAYILKYLYFLEDIFKEIIKDEDRAFYYHFYNDEVKVKSKETEVVESIKKK
jgi:hypothetical protein